MVEIVLIYRNRNLGKPGTSTLGLGVNAMHTSRALARAGYSCRSVAYWDEADIEIPPGTTHCVIEAPWVGISRTVDLALKSPSCRIYVRCHSNLAFLQVEPATITLMRDVALHGETLGNLRLATNSLPLASFFTEAYHVAAAYLPNLYDLDRATIRPDFGPGQPLRVGSFGAVRLQKNHSTAAAAAILMARRLGLPLEFHLMDDHGGAGAREVISAIRSLFAGLSWATCVVHPWAPFPIFRRIVLEMDIALHLTQTETFSLSSADCVAEGVPVVASRVIPWLPSGWLVDNTDDPGEVARVGLHVLQDHRSRSQALQSIADVAARNLSVWGKKIDAKTIDG